MLHSSPDRYELGPFGRVRRTLCNRHRGDARAIRFARAAVVNVHATYRVTGGVLEGP